MSIDNTRESILNVADKLFSRFGFYKTSMDEIAKIARKAKGSLYYHFASKEELFKEVVSVEIENFKKQLNKIVNNNELSSSEKIKQYFIKRMDVLNISTNYQETLKADFYEQFHFIDELRSELEAWEKDKLKTIISNGVEKREFSPIKDIDILLDMFIMVSYGLEVPFFLQDKYKHYSPYFESLIGILTKGLS
ncbi:MAG: TetR/AcrR family transcriptional regulator [Bacteroidales bacterium]|nr:TetR/AcrR family transcriptional regulator [Bacteroidales bacterium]MEA4967339.1 TetR/AcrR family transcriptional regulator [Bacteroidaceae bacterium]MEA5100437.1 TetR/AcrR family transcriptional regulator [Bacteroidales bacterium]